jgi:hypothetical protein
MASGRCLRFKRCSNADSITSTASGPREIGLAVSQRPLSVHAPGNAIGSVPRARRPKDQKAPGKRSFTSCYEISLDHDLGLVDGQGLEVTGYDVLRYIEQALAEGTADFPIPGIHIHSANAAVYKRMQQARESIYRLADRKP